jgi:hypothetical protein
MASSSLYDTFGNELRYDVLKSTLTTFLENATIKFPLPQASSEILGNLEENSLDKINPEVLTQVKTRLQRIGFKEANANALSIVLIKVAESLGTSPMEFFSINENTLKITKDAYDAINAMRPKGNRINLVVPKTNSKSPANKLIKA